MFSSLLNDLDALRLHTARFRRVALHIHSPDSHDWGKHGDAVLNRRERFNGDDGLDEYATELAKHLDFACISDHMRCSFASRLAARSRTPIVLPGMEINLRIEPLGFARIHVVTILPEGSGSEAFACLFAKQGHIPKDDSQRTGHEEVTGMTLKDWVDCVHDENGICIAAHIDSNNGIRQSFRQPSKDVLKLFYTDPIAGEKEEDIPGVLKDYLFDSGLDAIEIHKSTDGQHYRWLSGKDGRTRSIATLLTFDAHCCEAFDQKDKVTHVKMTSLGMNGLKNALRFADTRIRFPQNLPATPNPRLLGISIKGQDESFFKDVTIALAENLNCIIGVRGSGKSTIIEALRYVFGYNRSLNELGPAMADGIRDMQRANLKGTIIRVAYRVKDGDTKILQATFDEKSHYTTKCLSVKGEHLEVADVEDCGDFPLRLFGWSEIETLGRSAARQRDLLDRLIPELLPVLRRRKALQQSLSVSRGEIVKLTRELQAVFNRNGGHIIRFREYSADFDKLNTPEVRALFASLDLSRSKRRVLEQVAANIQLQIEQYSSLAATNLRGEVDTLLAQVSEALREWWLNSELQSLGVVTVEADVSDLVRQVIERLTAFSAVVEERILAGVEEVERIEQDLQAKFEQSGDDSMQRIADLRANAERRLNDVVETRRLYLASWAALQTALEARAKICEELSQSQDEIAGIRSRHNEAVEKTLNRFLPDWMKVSIHFRAGEDKDKYSERLKEVVPGRANTLSVSRVRQVMERLRTPVSCAATVFQSKFSEVVGIEVDVEGAKVAMTAEDADAWAAKIAPFEQHEHAAVSVLAEDGKRLNTLLDLQETPWEDYETILLDGGAVNEKSPGQRASAMLPLIALSEDTPLIIDQPEDNLDKRLIGGVLMKVLAELKEKRQITVCTHDPNILVGGDAEQVVVLRAVNHRRGVVDCHGSIDNEKIVSTVIDLLEGGAEAFETRRRRYDLDGENSEKA
jgi:ABC-type cobalamin/Fe3+-siderophores transport system ATPase subunit